MDPTGEPTCSQCGLLIVGEHAPAKGNVCVPCRRENGRRHYRENRSYYVNKARRRNAEVTSRNKQWVLEYLRRRSCVDCGTTDPRVLEFDHRDPSDKRDHVSALIVNGYSLPTIIEEIEKCDIRCANCHLIRTRAQRGWWKCEEDSASAPEVACEDH